MVEVVVRQLPVSALIPYRGGETEYVGVAALLDVFGPADICIVGSSRAHEGVVPAEMARLAQEQVGHPVTVANYACSGATAVEIKALVEFILRRGRPRLILYGLSPHQLLKREEPREQIALFWDWAAWRRYQRQAPADASRLLPAVVRNELGKWYRTLKYRRRLGVLLTDLLEALAFRRGASLSVSDLLAGRVFPCPARGERSRWHATHPDVSLVSRPLSELRLRGLLQEVPEGRYPMHGPQVRHVENIVSACNDAGVEIVLFEVPLSSILNQRFQPIYADFRATVQGLADARGVTFVRQDQLGEAFEDVDFREHSHLNYQGALRLTRCLFKRLVSPRLRSLI